MSKLETFYKMETVRCQNSNSNIWFPHCFNFSGLQLLFSGNRGSIRKDGFHDEFPSWCTFIVFYSMQYNKLLLVSDFTQTRFFQKQSVPVVFALLLSSGSLFHYQRNNRAVFHVLRKRSELRSVHSEAEMTSVMQGSVLFLAVLAIYDAESLEKRFSYNDVPSSLDDSPKLDDANSLDTSKDLTHVSFRTDTKGILHFYMTLE